MNILDIWGGVKVIRLEPQEDERGFFMRVYDDMTFRQEGLDKSWVQENHSLTVEKGTIRGLHFQLPPFQETKLVRVIHGAIQDVFVDLRQSSTTFGEWDHITLSAANKKMVYLPRGFAHGFCTLTKNSEVIYKVDNYYAPQHESGIRWNDPDIGIEWPVKNPILSEKDAKAQSFRAFTGKRGGL